MGRRCLRTIPILGFLVAAIGMPVPRSSLLSQKADEPFPCRYHACGCLDAASCRDHCCCRVARVPSCCAARLAKAAERHSTEPGVHALDCRGIQIWTMVAVPPLAFESIVCLDLSAQPGDRTIPVDPQRQHSRSLPVSTPPPENLPPSRTV